MKKLRGLDVPTLLASAFLAISLTWAVINKSDTGHSIFKKIFVSIAGDRPPGSYYDDALPLYITLYLAVFAIFGLFFALVLSRVPDNYRKPLIRVVILIGLFFPLLMRVI
jgi:preprotein translocase subunit SecY